MSETYTLRDAIEILQIDRGRINEWLSRGLIDVEHEIQKGSRVHKEYSRIDIYAVAIFKTLLEAGQVPRDTASSISKTWRTFTIANGAIREPLFISRKENEFQIFQKPYIKEDGQLSFHSSISGKTLSIRQSYDWDILFVFNINKILDAIDSRISSIL